MAASLRLTYNPASLGGQHIASAVRSLIAAKQEMARAIAIGSSVTANGVTPANLENSAEFMVAVSQGTTFQNALVAINTTLAGITDAQLAALDQG